MTADRDGTAGPAGPGPDTASERGARVSGASAIFTVGLALAALFGSGVWRVTGGAPDPAGPLDPVEQSALRPGVLPPPVAAGGDRPRYHRLAAVDWSAVPYPLTCPKAAVQVRAAEFADVNGDREPDATVLVRCAEALSGSAPERERADGTTPTGLFVYESGRAGTPRLLAALLRPADRVVATHIRVRATGIKATGFRYSSPRVPRCCPDETVEAGWRWNGAGFTRVG